MLKALSGKFQQQVETGNASSFKKKQDLPGKCNTKARGTKITVRTKFLGPYSLPGKSGWRI